VPLHRVQGPEHGLEQLSRPRGVLTASDAPLEAMPLVSDMALGIGNVPIGLGEMIQGGRHGSLCPELPHDLIGVLGQEPSRPQQRSGLVKLQLYFLAELLAPIRRALCSLHGHSQVECRREKIGVCRAETHAFFLALVDQYTTRPYPCLRQSVPAHIVAHDRTFAPLAAKSA
jgi:hypothetical protein